MIGGRILLYLALAQVGTVPPRDARPVAAAATASVTGEVVDDRGSPVPGASVVFTGGPDLPGARSAITTEDGRYRIDHLAVGNYTVGISKAGHPQVWLGQTRSNGPGKAIEVAAGERLALRLTLPRGAAIAGSLVDESGQPRGGFITVTPVGTSSVSRSRPVPSTTVNARGEFRAFGLAAGTYTIAAGSPSTSQTGESAGITLTLTAGEERRGIVLHVAPPPPTTSLTISASAVDGRPIRNFQVTLRRRGMSSPISSSRPNADGTRTVPDLPAGAYTVIVRDGPYFGSTDVMMDGLQPATVAVSLSRGVRISGTATFSGGAPARARSAWVAVNSSDADSPIDVNNGVSGAIEADGRFVLEGVPPGRYVLLMRSSSRDGWSLDAAKRGDADITDIPLTVGREDIDGVTVSVTREQTILRGKITAATGAPVNGVDVVAFPTDPKYRLRYSRRVRTNRTNVAGEYEIAGLPPGSYGLAIVDDVDEQALREPAAIAQLRAIATVTLAAGETKQHTVVIKER